MTARCGSGTCAPTGRSARRSRATSSKVNSVAFSPDGSTLASGGEDATVRLWSVATHRPRGVLAADTDSPAARQGRAASPASSAWRSARAAGSSPARTRQAQSSCGTCAPDIPLSRPLEAMRLGSRRRLHVRTARSPRPASTAAVRLWDARRARALGRSPSRRPRLWRWQPARTGARSPSAGADGLLQIWDARARRPLGPPLAGHAGDVNGGRVQPRRRHARQRRRRRHRPPLGRRAPPTRRAAARRARRRRQRRRLQRRRQDPRRRRAGRDGAAVGRRRPSPARPAAARARPGFVNAVAFSPDGHILASAGRDRSVWLWDVDDRPPARPAAHRPHRRRQRARLQPRRQDARLRRRRPHRAAVGRAHPARARPTARATPGWVQRRRLQPRTASGSPAPARTAPSASGTRSSGATTATPSTTGSAAASGAA